MSERRFIVPAVGATPDASRRKLLGGIAALGASAMLPGCAGFGDGPSDGKPFRIDVHHHIAPPAYIAEARSRKLAVPNTPWSAARSIEDMDKAGVAYSVTSLYQPAAAIGDVEFGRRMSRLSNDYAAQLARDRKGRFGTFATIPYADTEGSLREIAYALDTLNVEGFYLMTSYSGKYLGDPGFWPVLEELNRRKAVVYVHPLVAACCSQLSVGTFPAVIEVPHDTTRTVTSLLLSGSFARYRDIKWLFSHAGGTIPMMAGRIDSFYGRRPNLKEFAPDGIEGEFKRLYYDTANATSAPAMAALMKLVPVSQITYGSDYPYFPLDQITNLRQLGLTQEQLQAIGSANAMRLISSLKS